MLTIDDNHPGLLLIFPNERGAWLLMAILANRIDRGGLLALPDGGRTLTRKEIVKAANMRDDSSHPFFDNLQSVGLLTGSDEGGWVVLGLVEVERATQGPIYPASEGIQDATEGIQDATDTPETPPSRGRPRKPLDDTPIFELDSPSEKKRKRDLIAKRLRRMGSKKPLAPKSAENKNELRRINGAISAHPEFQPDAVALARLSISNYRDSSLSEQQKEKKEKEEREKERKKESGPNSNFGAIYGAISALITAPPSDTLFGAESSPPKSRKHRPTQDADKYRLPENWRPDTDDRAYARSKGMTDEQIDAQAERMAVWAQGDTLKNPRRTARGWKSTWQAQFVLKFMDDRPRHNGSSYAPKPPPQTFAERNAEIYTTVAETPWQQRLASFKRDPLNWQGSWGFPPGHPFCSVPQRELEKAGIPASQKTPPP